ncbi:hypothetical protein ROLI_026940 [Roseobacter fucihabitans]|uniref:Uncharacterized protein n=1 Tax=Roseobacter fucihabitans TaxID=1537242 RepID=A0ABZ2BXY6_9RHOB|nr:hypothetical protein [Roseobacter litoralis]MBC6967186.1 hypothetical protein [Roseobacter litoralis]
MNTKIATISTESDQSDTPRTAKDPKAPVQKRERNMRVNNLSEKLRTDTVREIEAMALFLLSDGRAIGQEAAAGLSQLEQQADMPLEGLISLHGLLAEAVAPAKQRSLLSLQQGKASGRMSGFLGPTPGVRRLSIASLFFALTFFAISLSADINIEAMSKSIYELNGTPLAVKLALILSAAGLGASFSALFTVWEDLRKHRYEPLADSAIWMQIGLGVVAGLMLAEIIGSEQVLVEGSDTGAGFGGMSDTLLALLGGFSASVIHMVLNSIVNALKRAFDYTPDEQTPSNIQMPFQPRVANPSSVQGGQGRGETSYSARQPAERDAQD